MSLQLQCILYSYWRVDLIVESISARLPKCLGSTTYSNHPIRRSPPILLVNSTSWIRLTAGSKHHGTSVSWFTSLQFTTSPFGRHWQIWRTRKLDFYGMSPSLARCWWSRTVYFMNLAIIEYIELLFYRDRARSSIMFPKVSDNITWFAADCQLKAMFCLLSYTVVVPGREPLYVSPISKSISSRWTDISREQSNWST